MADNSLTPEKREQFLTYLANCGNVTRAAEQAGLSRVYLYQVRSEEPEFAARWEEAAKIGAFRLEDEARRRGAEGVDEPVWHRGEMCGTVRKYSDTLLICLLNATSPKSTSSAMHKNSLAGTVPRSCLWASPS
ncbi:hypothetical protein [Desulfocurvibacter africanus]|uniref:hypothetical protein n=1 Tax=Desulfocurvibacter africanus TaxID=873 RepID=UPI0006876612|nr:hypothetical protein [Desulfocurvibacter africanus]